MPQVRALHPLPYVFGALTHWLSTCLSSRTKSVRFRYASPIFHASLAQSADAPRSNRGGSEFESRAMHQLPCPDVAIGRHRRLKSYRDARSSRARGTKSLTCPPSPIGRGDGPRSRAIGVRISGRVPILRRLAQWQSIRLISERSLDRSQDRRPTFSRDGREV
jgi:hypothetical protein